MNKLPLLAVLLVLASSAEAARRRVVEEEPKKEDWSSMKMEATAIMGELKYQRGDLSGARDTFRTSLDSSRDLEAPQSHVVGLDLYRTAELAARRGDHQAARENLDILISRYPDSEFAERGRDLLKILPSPKTEARPSAPAKAFVTADRPEFILARIQHAAAARKDAEGLELCREFLRLHAARPEAPEVRLLGAAMYLRLGDLDGAARALAFLAEKSADAEVRSKAVHLLAAVELARGRDAEVAALVPDGARGDAWLARAQIWRAAAERRLGRHDRAAARLRGFVDSGLASPMRAWALSGLAQDFERRGDLARGEAAVAETAAEAARWDMPELGAAAELSRAQALHKRQKLDAAAAAYAGFARRYPGDPQNAYARFQQGVVLRKIGRGKEALAAFTELVETQPDSVFAYDARLQLGQLHAEAGEPEKAQAAYEALAKSGGKRGRRESLLLLAQLHYNARRFKQAIPYYASFLEENPADKRRAEVEDLLLTSYWQGDRDNPDLLKAIDAYPGHPIASLARWELGAKAYKAGDFEKAAAWLKRHAEDDPRSPHAAESLFYLGEARSALSDAPGAAAAYRALLARHPKAPAAARAKARLPGALFAAGDYGAAADAYAALPGPDAAFNRALALEKAGRLPEALSQRERWLAAHAADPRASSVWLSVARGREAAGRHADAADAYMRVSDEGDRAASLLSAGRLREKLKQTAQAAAVYETLRALKPAHDPARLRGLVRLGLLREVAGEPLKALPIYSEVLKAAPRGGPEFKTAAERLEAMTSDRSLVGSTAPAKPRSAPR